MTRRRILVLTLTVYGTLAALGVAWASWAGRPWIVRHPEPWLALPEPWPLVTSLAAGVVLAVVTVIGTRVVVRRTRWARELHVGFRELLGSSLDAVSIAVLALASGIGEEVLFRGAMQPSLGLLPTAVLFGLLHIGPDRRFLAWTAWAVGMGVIFGAIHEATGSLAGCVLAHVVINYENLQFIVSYDPREGPPPAEASSAGTRLVGREERR